MSEVQATFSYTLINDGTEYEVSCSNKETATVAEIPSSHNGKPVTMIEESAFRNCSTLTSVTIPDSITSIGEFAFYRCSSLTTVTIPNSVTSIEREAFEYCSSLTSVTIGNSVTSIGDEVFYGCSSLTSITIPDSVEEIGAGAFYNCSSLTNITIPNSVTSIEYRTFAYCSGLTSVTIGNSVTRIEGYAFGDCSGLTSVTIGNSVTGIGDNAFYNCISLTAVILMPITVPTLGGNVFFGAAADIKFYCLSSVIEDYKTATNWNTYASKFVADDIKVYAVMNSISAKNYFPRKKYVDEKLAIKQDKLTQSTDLTPTTQTLTLVANTRYALGTLTALNITFPASGNDGDEIVIEFVSGSTATNLTPLDNVNAIYNFSSVGADKFIELNAQYKVSIGKWVVYSAETNYTVV